MNLGKKLLIGTFLAGTVFFSGCKEINVNVGEQDRGTVVGKILVKGPYVGQSTYDYVGAANISVWLTNSENPLEDTPYRTITISNGEFLIEVPAGSYDVHGCLTTNASKYNKKSVTVTRGETIDVGEIRLSGFPCPLEFYGLN